MQPSSWKPRHVIAVAALICGAVVLAPVAVYAVATQPVTIFDESGSHPADVNSNGALKVSDTGPSLGAHFWTAALTSQDPTATLGDVDCSTAMPGFCPWFVFSVGVTSLPSAKGPSYVRFRIVRFDAGQGCDIPPAGTFIPGTTWNLPSLWVSPKDQADYRFSVPQPWGSDGEGNGYCLVAYLVSGGPVEVHSEAPSESI